MTDFFTDSGPDHQCSKCGADTTGEIGHECGEENEDDENRCQTCYRSWNTIDEMMQEAKEDQS